MSRPQGRHILILASLLLACAAAAQVDQQMYDEQRERARGANSTVKSRAGSGEEVRDNFAQPLVTDSEMQTLDGSRSFSGQTSCQSTQTYLSLVLQPGQTGDIANATFLQDLDLDGTMDRTWQVPVPISGVCSNGIISCDAGTWDNCEHFLWAPDPTTGALDVAPAEITDLAACYCVNNHCGNNLVWSNLDFVVKDVGSGAAAAITQVIPYMGIGEVRASGPSIEFFAQSAGTCSLVDANGDPVNSAPNLTVYADNPQQLEADAEANANSPDSLYQTLLNSPVGQRANGDLHSCTQTRQITLDGARWYEIIEANSYVSTCGPGCIYMGNSVPNNSLPGGTCTFYDNLNPINFIINRPDRVLSATLEYVGVDDWIQLIFDTSLLFSYRSIWTDINAWPPGTIAYMALNPNDPFFSISFATLDSCQQFVAQQSEPWSCVETPRSCERNGHFFTLNRDVTSYFQQGGAHTLRNRMAVGGSGDYQYRIRVEVDESCQVDTETTLDFCGPYENQPNCQLWEEVVDGVVTYSGGNPTSITPLPSTQPIQDGSCSLDIQRNWWQRERTYLCTGGSQHAIDLSRVEHIRSTTTPTGYEDYRLDESTGSYVTTSEGLFLPPDPGTGACTLACKVRQEAPQSQVSVTGPETDYQRDPTSWVNHYYECAPDGGTPTCPLQPGDQLVQDCACINDFAEAASIMAAMDAAAQDMICTILQ